MIHIPTYQSHDSRYKWLHHSFEKRIPDHLYTLARMSYFDGEEGQIQAETMEITVSLVCQLSSSGENYLRMKKQVDRLIHRHEMLFTGMLRKLDSLSLSILTNEQNRQDIVDDHLCSDLTRIFNVLIQDDQITWGKIITILAFSTFIARKHQEIADRIAHVTGRYLVKKLSGWIREHGGWNSTALKDSAHDLDHLNQFYIFSLSCIGLSLLGLFLVLR